MPTEAIAPPAATVAALSAPAPSPNAAPAPSRSAAQSKPAAPAKQSAPATPAKVSNPFDDADAAMAKFSDPDKEDAVEKSDKPEAEMDEPPKEGDEKKTEEKLSTDTKPVVGEKPTKTSPWKLVESYKKTNTQLQQEIAQLRSSNKPGEVPKETQERFTGIEARNKELEEEIRHVNYSKSKEFTETYQKPYEQAWSNAIADLKELVITNDDGSARAATAQDLIALSNMPLGQARATAKAWFGDSADDVMSHRRTIRDLSDKQTKALEDSKKFGGEREQQRTAEMEAKHKARSAETSKVWKTINDEAVAKYEYLRPVDGETDRNEKLEKAREFVDSTLKKNINQAKTQEERDQILKAHAALRNRAVGFSVLKHENVSLKAKLAELQKTLAEFQGSEPTKSEPRRGASADVGGDEMASSLARMTNYVT